MLDPVAGPVNYLLGQAGLPQPGWLGDTFWAMPAIITGLRTALIYQAAEKAPS